MRFPRFLGAGVMLLALAAMGGAQTFIWTGLGTGWRGQGFPPNDGSATLEYHNALLQPVTLYGDAYLNSIVLVGDDNFYFVRDPGAPVPTTVTLTNGVSYLPNPDPDGSGGGRYDFASDVDLMVADPQTFDVGGHTVILRGHLLGTDDITLKSESILGSNGTFIFANTDTGNSGFSGNVTVDFATAGSAVAFWNTSPFGTGDVTFVGGGSLISHGTNVIANNLTLNTSGGPAALSLRTWDAPLTFSGNVTLAGNTILQPVSSAAFVNFANGTGVLTQPGTAIRQPVLFTGVIGESGGARSLTVSGSAPLILLPGSGTNTYTGGTIVGGSTPGSVIFGNNNAFSPGSGNVTVNVNGYAGIADLNPGNFFTQINQYIAKSSAGSIGVDTLPGNSTVTLVDDINLSSSGTGALSFTNGAVRLGTSTSAILTGNITPQGTNFLFGNGGGLLYVQSNLGDTTASGTATRSVNVNNGQQHPLKLFLQGTNTYTGGTIATGAYVIFDGASALPATGTLRAGGSNTSVGNSYIGYTDSTGLTPSAFLARFDTANTWGVVGFDTHAGNSTVNIGAIDLTGFNDGVFIGTATSAILTGAITGTTVLNTFNAPDTFRFTASNGGTLEIATVLADGAGPKSVMLGSPGNANVTFGMGSIMLEAANTYTGGTTINAGIFGTVVHAGGNSAFGTGAITINSTASGQMAGLAVGSVGITIANDLVFTGMGAALHLMGNNAFTLAGDISGSGSIQLQREMSGPAGDVTLAGDNSAFSGQIGVQHSTIHFAHDYASGNAVIRLFSDDAEAVFETMNPHVAGIFAETGSLILGSGANLTFDSWNTAYDFSFQGNITGTGGGSVAASVTVDGGFSSDNNAVYLAGNNTFTGGVNVIHDGVLILGSSQSAGTGTVTVNSLEGGLGLNTGVTFTNPLVLTQGAIAGFGTFAPTSFNGVPGAPITIGSNQFIIPTLPGITSVAGGTLHITGDLVFGDGGGYMWSLQDPTFTDGYGLVAISGILDLNSVSLGGFTIHLQSFDMNGFDGMANLTWGSTYNFTILTAAGGINGFNSNQFVFDTFDFQNGLIPASEFSVNLSGNNLVLHFNAVPEPSTWALLLTGGAGLGFAAWRRRRRRA